MQQRRVVLVGTVSFLLGLLMAWAPAYGTPGSRSRTVRHIADNKEYPAFFNYFQLQDTIDLDYEGLVVGDIDNFIFLGTACVVFDRMSDSLSYIDLEHRNYRALTVEDSLPGHKLSV